MKKITFIFVCLMALFQLSAQPLKIVGGDQIDISDAPYIVSIELDGERQYCGGVILNCEWILTAGHCILDLATDRRNDLVIHAGSTDQTDDENGQRIGVAEIITHPLATNSPINEFDIALIRLSSPLNLSNNIQAIEFATPSNTTLADIAPGQNVFISGWGVTEDSDEPVDLLRGVSIPIISREEANNLLPDDSNQVIDGFHIAVFETNTGAGSTDSGGPAIIEVDGEPMLVGIASWTYPPYGQFPTTYVSVRNFTEFIESNITEPICPSFCLGLDYQLVDTEGVPTTEYCPGEDVFVDVLNILDTDEYYIDLWTEEADGDLDWISGIGWVQSSSPDGINIVDLFENNPKGPVTFEEGVTYVVKIAIATPACGWIEILREFTFRRLPLEPADYIFQDENGNEKTTFCVGEDIWVDGSPTIGENRYEIYAWRLEDDGDKIWFGSLGSFNGNMGQVNISAGFANLNAPRYFDPGKYLLTIVYYSADECIDRTPIEKEFEVECCEGFLDASFSVETTVLNDNNFSIKAVDFKTYGNQDVVHEWYLLDASSRDVIASSIGGFQFNHAERSTSYYFVHKLRTPCGEICYVVAIIYPIGGPLNTGGWSFDCSIVDLDCPTTAPLATLNCNSGAINWNQVPNADGYVLRIYYDQGECCDTPLSQPDEVVSFSYNQRSYYSSELANAKCVTIQIGVRCEGEITWGSPRCTECCSLDEAPTDLAFNCLTNQGSFSEVAGAESYVVEVTSNDRDCFCKNSDQESKTTLQLGRATNFALNSNSRCFSIRVGAICKGVTVWSNKECYDCFDIMPRGIEISTETLRDLTIVPNPGTTMVRVQVPSISEVEGVYTIQSLTGSVLGQQKGSSLGLDVDVSTYPNGVYLIKFVSENGYSTEVQKLVVQH